jgi:thiol-disulfide isomerase/thioredoxin
MVRRARWLVQYSGRIKQLSGLLLVLSAVALQYQLFTRAQTWLADRTGFGNLGARVEERLFSKAMAAPVSPPTAARAGESLPKLPSLGPAPEFAGLAPWYNSPPLTLASLRGKVVLVDFWTYSCINCIRTLPYLESWYQKYAPEGFVIIGVHAPEFAFEHDTGNVQSAIARFGITYPVAQDNEFKTWGAYSNEYWPAHYLIDGNGNIRAEHFGEGAYAETEAQIRGLLAEAGQAALPTSTTGDGTVPIANGQTPETYLGSARASDFAGSYPGDGSHDLTLPGSLQTNEWAVDGKWDVSSQFVTTQSAADKVELRFQARDVYLVMSAATPVTAHVVVTGASSDSVTTEDVTSTGLLTVSTARLYHLVHLPDQEEATVTLTFDSPGVQVFAFTFGS